MRFMEAVYYAFEVADWGFANSTEIDMNKHKNGNTECGNNVKQIRCM